LGRKGMNHDIIRKYFCQQMIELGKMKYRYVAKYGKKIPVVLKTLAIIADRPERCNLNCILSHTGLTTKRWLYSAYIDVQVLPSCKTCLYYRVRNTRQNVFLFRR